MKALTFVLTRRDPFKVLLGIGLALIALGIGPRKQGKR